MDSTFFNRQDGPSQANQSFYERLRNPNGANLLEDDRNINTDFTDYNINNHQRLDESRLPIDDSTVNLIDAPQSAPKRIHPQSEDYDDNAVPESLLMEAHDVTPIKVGQSPPQKPRRKPLRRDRMADSAIPIQQTPSAQSTLSPPRPTRGGPANPMARSVLSIGSNPREKALWKWVNVTNLDVFMREVYDYFDGNGIWCILFDRALHIVETAFIAVFLTFLTQCISYHKIPRSSSLVEVIVPKCTQKMSGLWNFGIWLYTFYFIWKCVQLFTDARRLIDIRDFYIHLLNIPEEDMQTISWQDVVARIMALRDSNPSTALNLLPGPAQFLGGQSKEKLDAHDIANRLMRRDNYFIAMINKDILDLSFPVPFLGRKTLLSRTLEWYLYYCIIDFVFDSRGQVHSDFLKADNRAILSHKLKQRFIFAAIVNMILSPFMLAYAVIVYFFTYYNEYQRDPSKVGTRRYTPLAEWKLREFNELTHIFEDRLKMSYPFATRYLDQFPKKLSDRVFRTISFISGSLLAVLAIASLLDEKMFLGFEITPDRTVLFYLGILGVIWKGARDSIQEETLVFDPEYAMRNVIEYTRYMPDSWEKRLHSFDVKREFADMYKMKLIVFIEELVGIITTPLVLWMSMPKCSDHIVDFFREFTVHVDGLGYVCSFAVFDFKKGVGRGKASRAPSNDIREAYYATKHGKMAASYYGFLDNYVINPKTGIPGHLPPGIRAPLEEVSGSDGLPIHYRDHRACSHGPVSHIQAARAPRFANTTPAQPSPMGSVLLDPHHQPVAGFTPGGGRSIHHRNRAPGGKSGAKVGIAEESQDINSGSASKSNDDASDGDLGESMWQTSGGRGLQRDKSGLGGSNAAAAGEDAGVLGLIYQLQQAHRHRPGGTGGVI